MAARSLAPLRTLLRSAPSPLSRPIATSSQRIAFRQYSESAPKVENEEKRLEELEAAKQASEKKASELEAELQNLRKEMQYLRADMQTTIRRATEDKAKASDYAISKFALNLLETTDVLTKALLHVPQPIPIDQTHFQNLYTGVELTHKQLLKTFQNHGVKPMESPKGNAFDPNLHEATFQIPKEIAPKKESGDVHAPGEVVDVVKEGWTIGNRVLRPAQVGVVQME